MADAATAPRNLSAFVESALHPLDDVRRAWLRALVRVPVLRVVLIRRGVRVPILLSLHALAAFALALFVPSFSLVLGPIVLGVPHVAADIRYLVLRRALPRNFCRTIAAFSLSLVALRALHELRLLRAAPIVSEHALGSAWLLLAASAGALSTERRSRAAWVVLGSVAFGVFALGWPQLFRIALVHAHNLVALAIWLVLFRRKLSWAWLPMALVLAGGAALASGALLPLTFRYGVPELFGLHLLVATDWLAPGLPDATAVALTVSFAFMQSVHYAIWLIGIPQDDARAEGTPGFGKALRALSNDFSPRGVCAIAALCGLVLIAGVWSPLITRNVYLSLATFHTWLELALLAYFLARGSAANGATSRSLRAPLAPPS